MFLEKFMKIESINMTKMALFLVWIPLIFTLI